MLVPPTTRVLLTMSAFASVASGNSGCRSSAFVGAVSPVPAQQASHARFMRCERSGCAPRPVAMALPMELREGGYPSGGMESSLEGSTSRMEKVVHLSGGSMKSTLALGADQSRFGLGSTWGVLSVIFILMNAVKRLAPIALQPFHRGDFSTIQWIMYGGFSLLMAYAEGFKGFQKKFSPLVVKRALTLDAEGGRGPLRLLFAGPYSMGLFHATKKRRIVSWGLTTGVFCLVQLVKRLPYPWRSVVDAGVVVGLSYGMASICLIWARAIMGTAPAIDPEMPEPKSG